MFGWLALTLDSPFSYRYMFKEATNFNQEVGSWDVAKVTDMTYMFNNANKFDQCLLNTSFPGDATSTAMFDGTDGAVSVSDLSDCPTEAPTSAPHAPAHSTRRRLHFDHLSEAELEQLNENEFLY